MDEITIKSDSGQVAPTSESTNSGKRHNLPAAICALGLGISFILPWATIFGRNISGFELQKLGKEQLLLWLIPLLCVITIVACLTNHRHQIAGRCAGIMPYVVGVYWYLKLGNDFFQVLNYGAFLSLIFGAGLFVSSLKSK